jgi:hypothetical protein
MQLLEFVFRDLEHFAGTVILLLILGWFTLAITTILRGSQ